MDKRKMKKFLILNLPYFLVGLFATNLGKAWRLAEGADSSAKILSFFHALPIALNNPFPSFHPLDLLIGILCGAGLRLAVYLKGKNAKKYRHNVEYGSARWGTAKDIEPFIAPKFEDNVILTKTERLMMSNRPKNPANARNKNVLIIGGSGSGKTRFWLKPNLLQMHSSYVVTDPKGSIVIECGNALLKHGYTIKIFNTINFHKSMHYNPFAYGGDMKSVQGDSGHAQVKMVADVYSHIIDDDRRLNAERLEAAFYSGRTATPEPVQKVPEVTQDDDTALLMRLLQNPEMSALLKTLAKNL